MISTRALRAFAAGVLAGLFALGLDQLLAYLTLGFTVPLAGRDGAAYLVLAAFVTGVVVLVIWGRQRRVPDPWTVFGWTAAGIYAPAVFERVYSTLDYRTVAALAFLAAVVAVLGYAFWIFATGRLTGDKLPGLAPLLAAIGVAAGLAINRNLVDYPLEPAALAADAAVLAAVAGLAYLARLRGARTALAIACVFTLGVWVTVSAARWRGPSKAESSKGSERPNLVLAIVDTLRHDVFEDVVRSTEEGQAFREMVEGSAWFNQAIAASPWTVPSVGSIMTGLYPREHGFHAAPMKDPGRPLRPLSESVTTLAQHLSENGYQTEAIIANPLMHPVSGMNRGFDGYEVLSGPTIKLPPLTALARLNLLPQDDYQQADSVRRQLRQGIDRMAADGRPLFLWLHLMDPHSPLKKHRSLAPDPRSESLRGDRSLYRGEVRYSLRELTAMLRLLDDHDLFDNTVLIVVSDHGEMFPTDGHDNGVKNLDDGGPKLYGHGHAMYGELVRIPLVIRPPGGLRKSRRVNVLTSHVDLYDTMLDLLGVDAPRPGGDRVSLAPWLARKSPGAAQRGRNQVLVSANQHGPRMRALRTRRNKLIVYPDGEKPSELYDISADPREQKDLAAAESKRLARVEKRLDELWSQLGRAPKSAPAKLDAETLKRLKALGYLP